ncbi:ribose transport system permease protein [Hydrogenispora ethanolica]|uniref:Ribose transport system permease protein n=1 Tax=Hydrogenispora ethanolica TaxID=1082276 RepID=A0A4R1RBB9_HYDET|nr:ribose ABC transporter permease [Hydrogenispora ethanolica]TCL62752.1 ribose transport system permease protein [Hydrogenispora ethanolica]
MNTKTTTIASENQGIPFGQQCLEVWNRYSMYIIFGIIVVISALISDAFFTQNNLINVLKQVSVNGIISMGMLLVIIIGGIDLSVGSVLALTGALVAGLQLKLPLYQAVSLALIAGALPGLISGFFITKTKMAPFIMTLAMMTIARGMGFIYSNGTPIQVSNERFTELGGGTLGIIPYPVLIMLGVALIIHFIVKRTTFGREVIAVGNNEEAARLAGIPVNRIKLLTYTICAALSALAGIVLTSRLYIAEPMAGSGFELDAIAACVIGGASFNGGIGNVPGTLIGVVTLGLINNIMNLLNIQSYPQQVIKGLIIIAAIVARREEKR